MKYKAVNINVKLPGSPFNYAFVTLTSECIE